MPTNVNKSVTRTREAPGEAPCLAAIERSPNMLVPWLLMGAYAYQVLDESLISDGLYDRICKAVDAQWDAIEHVHKDVLDRAALRTGTSSYLSTAADYPGITRGATERLLLEGHTVRHTRRKVR